MIVTFFFFPFHPEVELSLVLGRRQQPAHHTKTERSEALIMPGFLFHSYLLFQRLCFLLLQPARSSSSLSSCPLSFHSTSYPTFNFTVTSSQKLRLPLCPLTSIAHPSDHSCFSHPHHALCPLRTEMVQFMCHLD